MAKYTNLIMLILSTCVYIKNSPFSQTSYHRGPPSRVVMEDVDMLEDVLEDYYSPGEEYPLSPMLCDSVDTISAPQMSVRRKSTSSKHRRIRYPSDYSKVNVLQCYNVLCIQLYVRIIN